VRRYRWIIIAGVIAAVLLAIVYGFLPKPVSVDMAKAFRGPLRVTVEEEGKTRVRDRYVLSAPVPGFMRRINLDVGDIVREGQPLVELEPLKSELLDPRARATGKAGVLAAAASLRAEEAKVRAARADADYAQKNLERIRRLAEKGYVSKDYFDKVEAEAKRTRATVLSTEAAAKVASSELEKAQAALRYSAAESTGPTGKVVMVRTPVGGSVLKIHHKSEGVVPSGEPLIDIGDPQKIEVEVEVLSRDAVKIRPGTAVLFKRWGGDKDLMGKVRVVEPEGFTKISSLGVEEQRVLAIVDITSTDESLARLGDGYRVEASFILWEDAQVLQVPASALFRKQDGWAVFVIANGRAHLREVQVGQRTGLAAEILSGLSEGEAVVAHPDSTIEDGVRVRSR
jgi:HlyD family secretion protein